MKAGKKIKVIIILAVLIIIMANIKPIGRVVYPIKYDDYIKKYSTMYNIESYMVAAIIKVESNYDKSALSKKNAIGLMQLTPSTAKEIAKKMNIENFTPDMILDPELNIRMGCWYIDDLKKEFGNNMDLVLAAYNGGRGNVKKWLRSEETSKDGQNLHYIPFKETDKYVKKVKVNYNIYKYLYSDKKHNLLN